MILKLINPTTMEIESVLSLYESVQWTTSYNTSESSFQIDCGIEYFDILKIDYYVQNSEDPDHLGAIKSIQTIKTNEKEKLQVKGYMLEKELLSKRIVKGIYTYLGVTPTFVAYNLIYQSMFETVEVDRKVPHLGDLKMPKDEEIPGMENTDYLSKYPPLLDEIYNLIQPIDLGFRVKLNKETNKLDLEFYVGTDHTQGSDDPILFAREYGTVLEVDYLKDSSQNITNLYALGEDNIYVEVSRERVEGEPLIENSIDISGEVPWPTYTEEKPEEDGGQYFRYKYFSSPEFITNQDIWEKYAVDRIETTETRYREVKYTEIGETTVGELMNFAPQLSGSGSLSDRGGLLLGSTLPTSGLANLASQLVGTTSSRPNPTIGFGNLSGVLSRTLKAKSNAIAPIKASTRAATPKKKTNKLTAKPSIQSKSGNTLTQIGVNNVGSRNPDRATLGGILEGRPLGEQPVRIEKTELQEYQVTTVTYETKEFLEYVYVNPGESPSRASKVIQGSVASRDVMFYENFVEIKVETDKYKEALVRKANDYLKTFVISESIQVQLYPLSNQRFRHEYNLGDIVTARDKEIGFATDLRITGATETWDSKGYNVSITLGSDVPSLTNRIKLISKGGS